MQSEINGGETKLTTTSPHVHCHKNLWKCEHILAILQTTVHRGNYTSRHFHRCYFKVNKISKCLLTVIYWRRITKADWDAWSPGTCQVGRLVRQPGGSAAMINVEVGQTTYFVATLQGLERGRRERYKVT